MIMNIVIKKMFINIVIKKVIMNIMTQEEDYEYLVTRR
jgi:hypothetical protein